MGWETGVLKAKGKKFTDASTGNYANNFLVINPDSTLRSLLYDDYAGETNDFFLCDNQSMCGTEVQNGKDRFGRNFDGQRYTIRTTLVNPESAGPPDPVIDLIAAVSSQTQIDLSWTEPDDHNSAITDYRIQRNVTATTFADIVTSTGSSAITFTDSGLVPGQYQYRIFAINLLGESGASNIASADTTGGTPAAAPDAPTLDSVIAVSNTAIDLAWTAGSDNGAAITGYKIERNLNGAGFPGIPFVANTGSTSTTFSDTTLSASDTAEYRVSAINSEGTSGSSNAISTSTPNNSVPDAPTLDSVTGVSASEMNLSWSANFDGNAAIIGYKIDRNVTATTFATIVSNTGSASTTFQDSGLAASSEFQYRIFAINNVGTSTASNIVAGSTLEESTNQLVVNSIDYTTSGGKDGTKHLQVIIRIFDDFGPVSGATVNIDMTLDGGPDVSFSGTTGLDGRVSFNRSNAPSGTWSTIVTNVIDGVAWDGFSPPNSFIKSE